MVPMDKEPEKPKSTNRCVSKTPSAVVLGQTLLFFTFTFCFPGSFCFLMAKPGYLSEDPLSAYEILDPASLQAGKKYWILAQNQPAKPDKADNAKASASEKEKISKSKKSKVSKKKKLKKKSKKKKKTSKKKSKKKSKRKKKSKKAKNGAPRAGFPGHMLVHFHLLNSEHTDAKDDPDLGEKTETKVKASGQKVSLEWLPGLWHILYFNLRQDKPDHETWETSSSGQILWGMRMPFFLLTSPLVGISYLKNTVKLDSLESPSLAITDSMDLAVGFKGRYVFEIARPYGIGVDLQALVFNPGISEDTGYEADLAMLMIYRWGRDQLDLRFGFIQRDYTAKETLGESAVTLQNSTESTYFGVGWWF